MRSPETAAPIQARFLSPGVWVLVAISAIGGLVFSYRLWAGLGPSTHLDDQHPWGLWIAVDVAAGVALAAGGFTTAALVEIFHRGRYRSFLRPALLTALLGYTFVVIGLLADLGRYYNVWHPALPWYWQGRSVLLEVGLCVMLYLSVLYLEFAPVVIEGLASKGIRWRVLEFSRRALAPLTKPLILLGVVLSCLHQSSLGTLMLIAPSKMHPLWYTPALPFFFLLSAAAAGFPVVTLESLLSAKSFHRSPETARLASLIRVTPILLLLYLSLKLMDVTLRDAWGSFFSPPAGGFFFLCELLIGGALPALLFSVKAWRCRPAVLLTGSSLAVAGLLLNRMDVFLVAYHPPYAERSYFPSLLEFAVTAGLISALILAYRAVVMTFPVLPKGENANETRP